MARKRYFVPELDWVFGVCKRCHKTHDETGKALLVARVPHSRDHKRYCRGCLGVKHRIIKDERAMAVAQ